VDILGEDQLESIHQASLRILGEIGIEFMGEEARSLFRDAGAEVDDASGCVRIDQELVDRALGSAPREFTLTPRNPDNRMHLGGNHVCTTSVGGPPSVHDCINGRRNANFGDYCRILKLVQVHDVIHCTGNQPAPPLELPATTRHLDCYQAAATLTDKCYLNTSIGADKAMDGIEISRISRGVSMDEMVETPSCLTIISVNSPRRFDGEMAQGLITTARHGQCCVVTPFTLMGAMTPTTLAGALSQQNAEALSGIVLTQLARPGAPVIYGSYTSNVDMRTGAPAFGTPEYARAVLASGQLARKYDLPFRCSNSATANTVDAQATWESEMSLWSCFLAHTNLLYHAAGWMEGGLCTSLEKFVLDSELLQMMAEVVQPVVVDSEALAWDAISEVPTGGQFFDHPHTLGRYRDAFYDSTLADWRSHEVWESDGARTATERATALWQQRLSEYEEPVLAPERLEELDAYVSRRKEEIRRALRD
jgi:trimethylamine--corrinoid protein Co-methyltransferase